MSDSKELSIIQVNKLIDTLISNWNMVFMQRYFEELKPAVKNREDAILGFMYGMICAVVTDNLMKFQNKTTVEDMHIVKDVFKVDYRK